MKWSAVGWAMRALVCAVVSIRVFVGADAFAQEAAPADSDLPAKKQMLEGMVEDRATTNDASAGSKSQRSRSEL